MAGIKSSTPNEQNATSLIQVGVTLGIVRGQTKEGCSEILRFKTDEERGLVESMPREEKPQHGVKVRVQKEQLLLQRQTKKRPPLPIKKNYQLQLS